MLPQIGQKFDPIVSKDPDSKAIPLTYMGNLMNLKGSGCALTMLIEY